MTFQLLPMTQLGWRHLKEYSVWAEYTDIEEIDEIVAWGIDRNWVENQIRSWDFSGEHPVYPVLQPFPLPERQRIYIRAMFTLFSGQELNGYIINEEPHAIGLFVGDTEYIFNKNLLEEAILESSRLAEQLGGIEGIIFPAHYVTETRSLDGQIISGVFDIG